MKSAEKTASGRVIWITGLSGAGKTTLARALLPHLPHAILLDGDEMREALGELGGGFDAASRKRLALTYARWARLLARQGFTVIVATISLFHEVHAWNREHLPNYLEVFLDVSEDMRRKRDPKGLYKGQARGQVSEMAGIETQVELPLCPHVHLAQDCALKHSVAEVLCAVKSNSPHCARRNSEGRVKT